MRLDGRRILVTGASSGLGRACALLASRVGARVVGIGRDEERLAATLDSLAGDGHQARVFDLGRTDAIADLVRDLTGAGDPFAGLVHAAGVHRTRPLQVLRAEDLDSVLRLDVLAASMLLRGLARRGCADEQGASAVLVGSVMSLVGAPALSAYCAGKAAVLGLVRAAALELASRRIRVNAVLPGYVETEMAAGLRATLGEEHMRRIEKQHPLGLGRPEDVAQAVVFLLAGASRWITGTGLVVDGGYTAA